MPEGTHYKNCEEAKRHICRCGYCGGALHGWQGWVQLARDNDRRAIRKEELTTGLTRRLNGDLRRDRLNLARITDRARVDIADHLARPANQRLTDPDRVEQLGQALAEQTWHQIRAAIDAGSADPAQVRRELAHHTWCDLIVGLIRLLDGAMRASEEFGEAAVDSVVRMILRSSQQGDREAVTEEVVRMVVNRVFHAIKTTFVAHVPVLQLLTDDKALTALRILAVFACPAPERHPELRKYALEPLAAEGNEFVSAEVKKWLYEVLPDWPESLN